MSQTPLAAQWADSALGDTGVVRPQRSPHRRPERHSRRQAKAEFSAPSRIFDESALAGATTQSGDQRPARSAPRLARRINTSASPIDDAIFVQKDLKQGSRIDLTVRVDAYDVACKPDLHCIA
jgi:hypothetical protein